MKLYGAMKTSTGGIDEATVLEMFSKRSIPQLRLAFSSYKQIYGHDFMKVSDFESKLNFRYLLFLLDIIWEKKEKEKFVYIPHISGQTHESLSLYWFDSTNLAWLDLNQQKET